jgi:rhodanese-related sulfurtransferase
MEGGVTFQTRVDQYNESLIQLLWNHKIKLVLFTGLTMIGYANIPYLKDTKRRMQEKATHGNQHLSKEDVQERVDIFDVILDVRSADEYKQGHVQKSVHVDYKDILEKGKDALKSEDVDKTKTILVYCKSGRRASIAVNHMIDELHYNPQNIYLTHESYDVLNEVFE